MIEYRNVSLFYDKQPVVQNINLQLQKGRATGILGPNGCGKSTLLASVRGLIRYTGEILLKGKDIRHYKQGELARILAVVPQMHHPSFPYTALEVVLAGRAPYVTYLPTSQDRSKAWECLAMVGAEHLAHRPYTKISGGERQLVLIARALCQEPQLILFDEPTAALDFKNTHKIMALIRQFSQEQGLTCIITVHDPNLALLFCEQAVVFAGGELLQGPPQDLITVKTIRKVYGMEAKIFHQQGLKFVVPAR